MNGLGRHREDPADREALIVRAEALHRITVEIPLQDRLAKFDSWRAAGAPHIRIRTGRAAAESDVELQKQFFLQRLGESRASHAARACDRTWNRFDQDIQGTIAAELARRARSGADRGATVAAAS